MYGFSDNNPNFRFYICPTLFKKGKNIWQGCNNSLSLHRIIIVQLIAMNQLKQIALLSLALLSFNASAQLIKEVPIDYSYCGYKASNDSLPIVPAVAQVMCGQGDMTQQLQQAIDQVARLPLKNGVRGAIQLEAGTYTLSGRLQIHASGIVLRGAGADCTRLVVQGTNRQPAILIEGEASALSSDTVWIQDQDFSPLAEGKEYVIVHPSTKEWIKSLGCDIYGGGISALGWKPGDVDATFRRTKQQNNTKNANNGLSAPIPMFWGEDKVFALPVAKNGRILNCGVENLCIVAEVKSDNPKDEQHLWTGISIEHAEDCWVRCVNFEQLAGSGVIVQPDAQRITVEDCLYRNPVSEEANHRRNAFYVMGQQTLVQRCVADHAMHAFATGWAAAGPNAFVQCEAREALSYSGAIDAWSTGLLMDLVDIDGHDIVMANITQDNNGAGWTSANGMCWNSTASRILCSSPDTLNVNRAFGTWCQFSGNGIWKSTNDHIQPRSLYYAQLEARLQNDSLNVKPLNVNPYILPRNLQATSSPTVEVAMECAKEAREVPRLTLENWIRSIQGNGKWEMVNGKLNGKWRMENGKLIQPANDKKSKADNKQFTIHNSSFTIHPLTIQNGKMLLNGELALGGKYDCPWWNGKLRPNYLEKKAQPALTRFVPDREGIGLTDRVDSVVAFMDNKNILAYDQCYGLWYDRRRDDHERIRRRDAECWAPFYEMPWARSGEGTAWEGLSRYDLTKPNLWYYDRLREFCQKAPNHLLYYEHYFQHNVLEAGAHWVDSPWRPVNNINGTVFPEPVPFAGDKRVFVAEWFYDEQNPTMRELHRQYIRQNLEQFRDQPNVVHLISNEYTGPLHFTRFWLECIAEWEAETGLDAKVALACTKDVQDSLLADPKLNKSIDIIQIQYWFYRVPDKRNPKDIWDPLGGLNMAPRQHIRKQPVGKTGFAEAYKSVYEYTSQYPDKAVTFYAQNYPDHGWAVLMAGGSCSDVQINDKALRAAIVTMRPQDGPVAKVLSNGTSALLYFTTEGEAQVSNLKPGKHQLLKVSKEGVTTKAGSITVSASGEATLKGNNNEIYWIK